MSSLLIYVRKRAGEAAFDPGSLFASSEGGAYYDPSDSSTVFQERTGASATTAAGDGDPVGTILDKSGNGNHLTAPSDSQRPVLRDRGSGVWALDFDGADDRLTLAAPAFNFAQYSWLIGVLPDNDDETIMSIANGAQGERDLIYCIAPGNFFCRVNNTGIRNGTTIEDITSVLEVYSETAETFIDGADEEDAADIATVSYPEDMPFHLGGKYDDTANRMMQGDIHYVLVIDRNLTTSERSDLRTFIAGKQGRSL